MTRRASYRGFLCVPPEIAADVAKSIEESEDVSQLTAGDGLAYQVGEPLQFDASKLTVKADGETIKLGPDGELKPVPGANARDDKMDMLAIARQQLEYELARASKRQKAIIPKDPSCCVRTAEVDWPNKVWIDLPFYESVTGNPDIGTFRIDQIIGVLDYPGCSDRCRIQLPHHDMEVLLPRKEVLDRLVRIATGS